MSFPCVRGLSECDGCGACEEENTYYCPVCGRKLYGDDAVYKAGGEIIGCEYCVKTVYVEDLFHG